MSKKRNHNNSVPASTLLLGFLVAALLLGFVGTVVYQNFLREGAGSTLRLTEEDFTIITEPPTEPPIGIITVSDKPTSVFCKESYSVSAEESKTAYKAVAVQAGDAKLTNAQLQIYYLCAIAAYRDAGHTENPDYTQPLEQQVCPLASGMSWQHYFLKQAVANWLAQQAMLQTAQQPQKITEEAFQPLDYLHDEYVKPELPVHDFLYSDRPYYKPNTQHQAYLDGMEKLVEELAAAQGYSSLNDYAAAFGGAVTAEDLVQAAKDYNMAYMYFTERSYEKTASEEEVKAYYQKNKAALEAENIGVTVDMRHVLRIPADAKVAKDGKVTADEEQWEKLKTSVDEKLTSFYADYQTNRNKESNFARMANQLSEDDGSQVNGGYYYHVRPGQMNEALDGWLFSSERKPGDIGIVRSDLGYHIVYLSAIHENAKTAAAEAVIRSKEEAEWKDFQKKLNPKIDYSAMALWVEPSAKAVSMESTLYPDVAHERFPEAITYFQQDYMYHPYGGSYVGRGGCGITTMAMLATYMTDSIQTPGMLATAYWYYHDESGTNGDIFRFVPADLGFYMERTTANLDDAITALKSGQRVISLQQLGNFTRGGHYLLLQKYNAEDDSFQVRDSNIYNYGRLPGHAIDSFTRADILSGNTNFYIMQKKITRIPACIRCGSEAQPELLMSSEYTCEKCAKALSRRDNYLSILNELGNS